MKWNYALLTKEKHRPNMTVGFLLPHPLPTSRRSTFQRGCQSVWYRSSGETQILIHSAQESHCLGHLQKQSTVPLSWGTHPPWALWPFQGVDGPQVQDQLYHSCQCYKSGCNNTWNNCHGLHVSICMHINCHGLHVSICMHISMGLVGPICTVVRSTNHLTKMSITTHTFFRGNTDSWHLFNYPLRVPH